MPRESSRRFQARQSRDCTLLQTQVACQNRREAKSRRIKEFSRQFNTRTVEGGESVEKAGTRQPNSSTRNGTGNPNGLRKVKKGRIAPNSSLGKRIASVRRERTNCRREGHQARLRCATKSSIRRVAEWNLESTILREVPWCRRRSSSWNRNVPHVVFRFWNAQLTN